MNPGLELPKNQTAPTVEDDLLVLARWHGWNPQLCKALADPNIRAAVHNFVFGSIRREQNHRYASEPGLFPGDPRRHINISTPVLPGPGLKVVYNSPLSPEGPFDLFVDPRQQTGSGLEGHELARVLEEKWTVGATRLDDLLEQPEKIPLAFIQYERIFFFGTRFEKKNRSACVVCLRRTGSAGRQFYEWRRGLEWLGFKFGPKDAALIIKQC